MTIIVSRNIYAPAAAECVPIAGTEGLRGRLLGVEWRVSNSSSGDFPKPASSGGVGDLEFGIPFQVIAGQPSSAYLTLADPRVLANGYIYCYGSLFPDIGSVLLVDGVPFVGLISVINRGVALDGGTYVPGWWSVRLFLDVDASQ